MIAPLRDRGVPIVVDPVLGATAGGWYASDRLLDVYRNALAPLADLLTPNLEEIERLAPAGPRELLDRGCRAVLVKGGHAAEDPVEDRLWALAGDSVFRHPRLDVGPVHGTGCALATAIACGLARGDGVEVATRAGVTVLHRCLVATTRGRDGHPVPLAIV
jgi:hydroxymethylpyrimidine/phosphomethylpyrimidine kinase